MKVLIIGSGGREHAIAWKVSKSDYVSKIYCAPGNAGIGNIAECVPIGANDLIQLADFAEKEQIDLTIVGMDEPLVNGIVDVFEERGLFIFGPREEAALLEGSKSFSKELMKRYNIPSAKYEKFTNPHKAQKYIDSCEFPIVIKADGLCFGKGVLICENKEQALDAIKAIMLDKEFGSSGDTIIVEEFLKGREVSVLGFCDGRTVKTMTSAQDYKRINDGDTGLNTGGMGTFSPSPFYTKEIDDYCKKHIYQATVDAMRQEGRDFVGILYFGLMLTKEGPKVLEYNVRFGDPEAQVVLPRMKNDIIDIIQACLSESLEEVKLEFEDNAAVCVVLASGGYPKEFEVGKEILGLEKITNEKDNFVFHAGTKESQGKTVTNGGRVLGVTALGKDLTQAHYNAYAAAESIDFEGKYMRTDIAKFV